MPTNRRAMLRRVALAHGRITAPAVARTGQLDGMFATVTELLAQLVNHARAALLPALPHLFSDSWHRLGLLVSRFLCQQAKSTPRNFCVVDAG